MVSFRITAVILKIRLISPLIDLAKGKIGYHIVFYDDINQKLFDENVYLYGIYWGGTMNFEKVNEEVMLSI